MKTVGRVPAEWKQSVGKVTEKFLCLEKRYESLDLTEERAERLDLLGDRVARDVIANSIVVAQSRPLAPKSASKVAEEFQQSTGKVEE